MVSHAKRIKYEAENVLTTSDEESNDDTDYAPTKRVSSKRYTKSSSSTDQPDFQRGFAKAPGRKPRRFSKNALMARENRLKKKLYISQLENDVASLKNENKKLSKVVENQSCLISELKKEVRYLKSVIANSTDISNLIRNIHQSTGMSVSSSLDKTLSLKNVCIPKPELPIARKTAHPWEEGDGYPSYPTPDSNCFSSPNHSLGDFLNDVSLDIVADLPDILSNFPLDEERIIDDPTLEHNYTITPQDDDENLDDVGVCLHVSKHRVSLEFCAGCSENAAQ